MVMLRWILSLTLATVIAAVPAVTHALVVYDNGDPGNPPSLAIGPFGSGSLGSAYLSDDFAVDVATTITGLSLYFMAPTDAPDVQIRDNPMWRISLYSGAPGTPVAASPTPIVASWERLYTFGTGVLSIWRVDYTLRSSFAAAASTPYRVNMDFRPLPNWFSFVQSSERHGANAYILNIVTGSSAQLDFDLPFQLTGTPVAAVPEPGTAALFAAGWALWILAMRRGRRRRMGA